MESSRKQFRFEVLIERYFSNLWRIILTNILFFVPLAVLTTAYYFLSTSSDNMLLHLMMIITCVVLVFPFYAGVVLVCRNISRGDKNVSVVSDFIKGLKENFLRFMLYGLMASVVTILCYYSIFFYSSILSQSWTYYVMLFVCVIISLLALFTFFYLPVMAVTFDLSVKHTLKNSFLMSFGELKNNFKAFFSVAIVLAIGLTIVAFCTNVVALIIVTIVLIALIIPASCQTVLCFHIYDGMYSSIVDNDYKAMEIDNKITDQKNKKKPTLDIDVQEDFSDVDITKLKDSDEYIFYNGKMIKQSVLLRMVLEQRGQDVPADKKDD